MRPRLMAVEPDFNTALGDTIKELQCGHGCMAVENLASDFRGAKTIA